MKSVNDTGMKRAALINDLSCLGKCSLSVALPILSAAGVEAVALPTAILSTHTGGFDGYVMRDMTEEMQAFIAHWQRIGVHFDCIYTGDLGLVGSQMLRELLAAEGLLLKNHADCGCLLYDAGEQRVKSGGSGAGCCAAVLCGHILPKLLRRGSRRVLFIATGALMSQTTFLQKESIPAVAHLVELTAPEKEN